MCHREHRLTELFSSFAPLSKSSLQMTCRSSPSSQPRRAGAPCPAPSPSLPLTATAPVGARLLVHVGPLPSPVLVPLILCQDAPCCWVILGCGGDDSGRFLKLRHGLPGDYKARMEQPALVEGWNWVSFEVPSNQSHSMNLCESSVSEP